MQPVLIVGIILTTGFLMGELAAKLTLPKVTGYLLAGVLLNPGLSHFIPVTFSENTDIVTNISLAFITFSVGGTLRWKRIKILGKSIAYISVFAAQLTLVIVAAGSLLLVPHLLPASLSGWITVFLPLSLLFGVLAAPTDPSVILAVAHEFKVRGDVKDTVLGVTAVDDALGILNYSIVVAIASVLISRQPFGIVNSILDPLVRIVGAACIGIGFGYLFNRITRWIRRESEGVFIVMLLGLMFLCFGLAKSLAFDELLATMMMGLTVVNFNPIQAKIFKITERYTEELIFVLFFTVSGMQLQFGVLLDYFWLVLWFVLLRLIGKVVGSYLGAVVAKAPSKVKKYTAGGLIPQGGVVIGLALMVKQTAAFAPFADILLGVIIGATVIHELIGPLITEYSLKRAGELEVERDV
ncbi:MAG: cation:proton antiporter [Fidelibacterota bacterium]